MCCAHMSDAVKAKAPSTPCMCGHCHTTRTCLEPAASLQLQATVAVHRQLSSRTTGDIHVTPRPWFKPSALYVSLLASANKMSAGKPVLAANFSPVSAVPIDTRSSLIPACLSCGQMSRATSVANSLHQKEPCCGTSKQCLVHREGLALKAQP